MIQLTAAQAKEKADMAANSTRDALFQNILNKIAQESGKWIYSVDFTFPKYQAAELMPLLEEKGYTVTGVDSGKNIILTIDFSAPKPDSK